MHNMYVYEEINGITLYKIKIATKQIINLAQS